MTILKMLRLIVPGVAGLTLMVSSVASAAPDVQVGTNQGGSFLCMNRAGGGSKAGTSVIAYNCGDSNNYFQYYQMETACGGGHVTSTCPFTDTYTDQSLEGYAIIGITSGDTPYCVGATSNTSQVSALVDCSNNSGTGGGSATLDVLVGVQNLFDYDGAPTNIINVHWTNENNGNERYIGSVGYRDQWSLDGGPALGCPGNENCVLREIY